VARARSVLPVLLALLGSLVTVALGVALNVATGGTLPGPLRGYQNWAWPALVLLTVMTGVVGLLEGRARGTTPDRPAADTRPAAARPEPGQRVVGERVSAAVDVFCDRHEFRARLRELVLSRERPIISVVGRRGIGKSGLVARVLADFEEAGDEEGIGGLAYVSTRTGVGVVDLGRVFDVLSRLLPSDQRRRFQEQWTNAGPAVLPELLDAVADRRAVLVLDNLDDLQDPDSGRLESESLVTLLDAVSRHRRPPLVVTTSQRPLQVPPGILGRVTTVELDEGLATGDAVALLRLLDTAGEAGLRDLSDAELREAAERVHGMPRGLELLVALLADRRTETVQRIFDADETPDILLGRLVSEGFTSLDAVGRDVVRVLALADTPLGADALPEVLDGRQPAAEVALTVERLARRRMIGFDRATRRARLHPLDSDYVRGRLLDDPGQRAELDLRLAGWLATRRTGNLAWRTIADVEAQRREVRHRLRAADWPGALQVIASTAEFLAINGQAAEIADTLAQVRGHIGTPELRAVYELARGAVEFAGGSLEEAVAAYRAGRAAALRTEDKLLAAKLAMNLGNTLRHMGDAPAAREPLEAAAGLPITDQASRAVVLQSLFILGLVACYLADVEGAAASAARCQEMVRPDDPQWWHAWLADLRALVALLEGDHAAALAEIERGIAAYSDSPEQSTVGYLVNVRGLVLLAQGHVRQAAHAFASVRDDARRARLARLEGLAMLNLAWTLLLEGDPVQAGRTAREAADRLAAHRVREERSAVELAAACEAGDAERPALLARAVEASYGNPDLYQPPEGMLAKIAEAGSLAGDRPG
jgi:tetratricopeptide (TPR) repeat protein